MDKEYSEVIFSIIMPVYNAEKTLDKTIQSVLQQTTKDFEFIIVDDGSCDESHKIVLIYQKVRFKTYSGLPFSYEIRKGRSGEYTKELWIDRRENSKSLAWSSVLLALGNVKEIGAVVDRPKALGDIRGVTYIYGMFYRFGLIDVPDKVKEKMNKCGCVAKS